MPYLRPYDVFEYLPPEADRLSVTRTARLEDYLIQEGDILQTCSGRNLGPVTIADSYLTQSALSHDMIRMVKSAEVVYLPFDKTSSMTVSGTGTSPMVRLAHATS